MKHFKRSLTALTALLTITTTIGAHAESSIRRCYGNEAKALAAKMPDDIWMQSYLRHNIKQLDVVWRDTCGFNESATPSEKAANLAKLPYTHTLIDIQKAAETNGVRFEELLVALRDKYLVFTAQGLPH